MTTNIRIHKDLPEPLEHSLIDYIYELAEATDSDVVFCYSPEGGYDIFVESEEEKMYCEWVWNWLRENEEFPSEEDVRVLSEASVKVYQNLNDSDESDWEYV